MTDIESETTTGGRPGSGAHRAVAQDLRAARVGRDEAADRGGALSAEGEGKAQTRRLRRLVQRLQDDAGFGSGGAVFGIERADAGHPAQAEEQRMAAGVRRRAARHAAVAALGNDGHAMLGAEAHERGDFRG